MAFRHAGMGGGPALCMLWMWLLEDGLVFVIRTFLGVVIYYREVDFGKGYVSPL
jgi:hypothetical protein